MRTGMAEVSHLKILQFIKKNPHVLLALYLPVFLAAFFLLEHYVDGDSDYWVSYLPLDDRIPFLEGFVLAYCLWYPLLLVVGLWLMVKDAPAFCRYMYVLILGFSLSLLFCAVFPNGQNLRPAVFPRDNFCTRLLALIYAADTNTNVMPSMHVIGAAAAVFGVFDSRTVGHWTRAAVVIVAVLICASTVFVKQHSVLDIVVGAAVCVPLYFGVYGRRRRKPYTTRLRS